jgi:hypothetical protein
MPEDEKKAEEKEAPKEEAKETPAKEEIKAAPQPSTPSPPPPAPPPRPASGKPKFLSTTKGKVIALLLIIIVIGAIASTRVSFSFTVTKSTTSDEEANVTLPEDYYAEETLSFQYGHRRAPMTITKSVTFPVEYYAYEGTVETEGDPGAIPRGDGGDRKEVDIEVMGADGQLVGSGATPQMNELVELRVTDFRYGGVGDWEVVVDCYSGTNVQVTVKITVIYAYNNDTAPPNETDENETMIKDWSEGAEDDPQGNGPLRFVEREARDSI